MEDLRAELEAATAALREHLKGLIELVERLSEQAAKL